MGVVWCALDVNQSNDPHLPLRGGRSIKEWKMVEEISHPNIAHLRDVDVVEREP